MQVANVMIYEKLEEMTTQSQKYKARCTIIEGIATLAGRKRAEVSIAHTFTTLFRYLKQINEPDTSST